mmetsp:Transcript_47639/g.132527  ORF Transcript_47639/g.132527 Transcript_47639/m.132527 type:complete len:370 (+) Transcript_47639:1145-2254(+)
MRAQCEVIDLDMHLQRQRCPWNLHRNRLLFVLAQQFAQESMLQQRRSGVGHVGAPEESAQVGIDRLGVPRRAISGAALRASGQGRPLLPGRGGRAVPLLLLSDARSGLVVGAPEPQGLRLGRGEVLCADRHGEEVLAAFRATEEGADGRADDLHWCLGRRRLASLPRRGGARQQAVEEKPEPAGVAPRPRRPAPAPRPALPCEVRPGPATPAEVLLHGGPVQVVERRGGHGVALRGPGDCLLLRQLVPVLLEAGAHLAGRLPAAAAARPREAEELQEVEERLLLLGREVERREGLVKQGHDGNLQVLCRSLRRLHGTLHWLRPAEKGRVLVYGLRRWCVLWPARHLLLQPDQGLLGAAHREELLHACQA